MILLFAGYQFVYADQFKIGAQNTNVFLAQKKLWTPVSAETDVQDSNRIGAQDARYPAMSVLYSQHSLQDSKLASCEEQGPSR
jgi:hypothetical protein